MKVGQKSPAFNMRVYLLSVMYLSSSLTPIQEKEGGDNFGTLANTSGLSFCKCLSIPSLLQSSKMIKYPIKLSLKKINFHLLVFLESKMIEKHGGYKFSAPVVPSSFNFGGPAPGMN